MDDVATAMFRGSGITREQITAEETPCVRYGEIYTRYDIWFDQCISYTNESSIQIKKYIEHGGIIFAITGESAEDIAKSSTYIGHERCLAGGDMVVMRHTQVPKYLSYALSTSNAREQESRGMVKSKVVRSSIPALKRLAIPIPPLAEQER